MNPCCLLALLTLTADPVAASHESFDAFGALAAAATAPAAPTPAPTAPSPLQRGGLVAPQRPTFFVSGGYHIVEPMHTFDGEGDSDAVSIDLGYLTWNGEMGFGIEAGFMQSNFETDLTVFLRDEVDSNRYLVGLRFIDSPVGSNFAPYLRGGYLFREDKGDVIDDSGSGWYFGGGIDYKLGGSGFSVAPQVLYTESSSLDSTEWLFGLTATIAF